MLHTDKHPATIVNVNHRIEKHGDKRVLAVDIKLATMVGSDTLNDLEPGLRETLFRQPRKDDQLSLVEKNDQAAFTVLKHACLEPVRLKKAQRFPGYELTLGSIIEGVEDELFFVDTELKGFGIEPFEGGTAALTFTASTRIKYDESAQLLEALVDEDCTLTLTPPQAQAQTPADDDEHREAA